MENFEGSFLKGHIREQKGGLITPWSCNNVRVISLLFSSHAKALCSTAKGKSDSL